LGWTAIPIDAASIPAFNQTTLLTNASDPDLINPWGISFSNTSPFWVSDQATGKSTLYSATGVKQALIVTIPGGNPTGQVNNGTANFNGDLFLFATLGGSITGWRGALGTTAETLFTEPASAYTGLAISAAKDTLYAANARSGAVDVFNTAGLTGSFFDPTIPTGFTPYAVQNLGGTLYVTFSNRLNNSPGAGYVDTFDPVTHTFTRLISNGALDQPWGAAIAPAAWGQYAGDLLVGNFGDGKINIFNPTNGALIGTIATQLGTDISNPGLWAIVFGNNGAGSNPNSLYLVAGGAAETTGIFARIDFVPEPASILGVLSGLGMLVFFRRRRAS